MMATDILKQQHREFEELTRQIEMAEDDEERSALRAELADMLAAHTAIEEELVYPVALEHLGHGARIRESLEEHAVADFALYRLVSVSVADETFSAKLATLKDVVMNHIEEEESELFPQVEGEIDRQVLEQLGDKITVRFEERLREGHRPILERSLGIAARQVAVSAPGAKKAASKTTRAGAKRKVAPQKRPLKATKRGQVAQRSAAPQKSATPQKSASSKKALSQGQTSAKSERSSNTSTARRNQSSPRSGQKTVRRGTRSQTASKKSRAVG